MINKIDYIKNIGVFKTYNPRLTALESDFKKCNFLYAENRNGKSTLCDIFKEASNDSTSLIKNRLTIPGGEEQKVVINLSDKNDQTILADNKWINNSLKNRIMVFDTKFIENNIFDKQKIIDERDTKINFSNFILGDEGVSLAKQLTSLTKQRTEIRKELTFKTPNSQKQKDDDDIINYIKIEIGESKDDLLYKQKELKKEKLSFEKQQTNIDKISKIEQINFLKLNKLENIINDFYLLKKIFNESYSMSGDIIEDIKNHKEKYLKDNKESDAWLEKGMTLFDLEQDSGCPFCGQPISKFSFIKKYQEEFLQGYEDYRNSVINRLEEVEINWDIFELTKKIEKFLEFLEEIEKETDLKFKEHEEEIKAIKDKALSFELNSQEKLNKIKLELEKAIRSKKAQSSIVIKTDFLNIDKMAEEYSDLVKKTNKELEYIDGKIKNIKKKTKGDFVKKIQRLEEEKENITFKIQRLEESGNCDDWMKTKKIYDKFEEKIKDISNQLDNNQDAYLDKYFEKIDELFREFGGRKFKINRGKTSNRGHKKTFGIKIKFNNQHISDPIKIGEIFSESDRRALGLAIFVSKIYCMTEEERSEKIFVLDDPVTSFDDNRMKSVVKNISDIGEKVKQVFILTHNTTFSKEFHESNSFAQKEISYYEIKKIDKNSNGIFDMNPEEKFSNDFIKAYDKINKFIEFDSDRLHYTDLRIFLEEYLKLVFVKQFKENKLSNLKLVEKINHLEKVDVIEKNVATELHKYRNMFNPESHTFTTSNDEELRNMAYNFISYLFKSVRLID